MPLSRLSIKHQLFLIVSIIAFPAICIIINSGLQQRKDAFHDAQMETQKLAETIVSEQKNLVASTRQLFIALSQVSEVTTHKHDEVQDILTEITSVRLITE
jgi:signal transduction histidine kinase